MIQSTNKDGIALTYHYCAIINICHGWSDSSMDSSYIYGYLITNFHVRFPFEEFNIGVLHILDMVLIQLLSI